MKIADDSPPIASPPSIGRIPISAAWRLTCPLNTETTLLTGTSRESTVYPGFTPTLYRGRRLVDDNKHLWITPGGQIFFKLGIPKHLRHHFRTERGTVKDRIVESTGTDSPTAARLFRDKRLGYWRAMFEHLARGGQLGDPLPMRFVPFAEAMGIQAAAPEQRTQPDEGDLLLFELDRLLERANGRLPPQVQALGRELARAIAAARYGFEAPGVPAPTPPSSGETFAQALAAYLTWLKDERQARTTTVADFQRLGQKFLDHAGDLPLSAITYDVAKAFVDRIAADSGNGARANAARSLCYSTIKYAKERTQFTGDNPFEIRNRKHVVRSHAKFTGDDLRAIFGSAKFTRRQTKPKQYDSASALPWVAAIALYTGMRAEEICQLRPGDLRQENGIWLLEVTPDAAAAGELKTDSSKRKVPVHSALKALGLLNYRRALPKNAERLFPNLPARKSKGGKFAPAVGDAFADWRKSVGVHRPPEKLDLHSFRHTFSKQLETIGVSPNDAARLLGHEVEGLSFGRYSAPELKRLAKVIEQIKYDGLRL
jgi:integrase